MQLTCLMLMLVCGLPSEVTGDEMVTGLVTEAPITEVVVYENGARITRKASVRLPEGRSMLAVDLFDLSPDQLLDENELDLISTSTGEATRVLSIRLTEETRQPAPERFKILNDRIESLETELASARRLERNAEADLQLLDVLGRGILGASGGKPDSGAPDLKLLEEHLEFISSRRMAILEIQESARARTAIQADSLAAARLELGEARRERRMATVRMELDSAGGEETIEITWLEFLSSWNPELTVRTSDLDGATTIEMHANVVNRTNTDWNGVALTLSTGDLRGEVPRSIAPILVDIVEDEESEAPAPVRNMLETEPDMVTVYALENPTFLNRGEGKLLIKRFKSSCLLEAIMRPVIQAGAWSRGSIENTSELVLLPGFMRLYLDERFVGMLELDRRVDPGGTFVVWFGELRGISINREIIERETVKTGLLGGGRLTTTRYRISILNERPNPVKIVVEDRMPVSSSEDIEVSLKNVEPPLSTRPAYLQEDRPNGLLQWTIEAAGSDPEEPGAVTTIEWTVNVSHSSEVDTTPIPR